MEIKDRTALITGAGSGYGYAVSLDLAGRGVGMIGMNASCTAATACLAPDS